MHVSLRASFPIWASKASLARTRERAAKPRGTGALPRSRVLARLARPNRRACSQARCTCKIVVLLFFHSKPFEFLMFSLQWPSSSVKFPLSSGLCFQTTGARIGSIDAIYTSFYSGKWTRTHSRERGWGIKTGLGGRRKSSLGAAS